jgi:hypothetical protein
MAGSLGNLVVSLIAETAQFRSDMGKAAYQAEKSFKAIKSSAQGLAAGLGVYLSARMFVDWIQASIDASAAIYNLSQKTGIATDSLSKLQYAAKVNDVAAEEFGSSLIKLNKAIAEAAAGTGDAKNAFDAMKISVKDAQGNIKGTDVLLGEIANRFASYEDGANKSALAIALFGRSGAALIPMLNEGKVGLDAMGKELERLGGVILPDAAKRADEFKDNLDKLKVSFNSTGIEIGNMVLPYLKELSDQFLVARKNALNLWDVLQIGTSLPVSYENQFKKLTTELQLLDKVGLGNTAIARSLERQKAYYQELIALKELNSEASKGGQKPKPSDAKQKAPSIAKEKKSEIDDVTKALERQTDAVNKLLYSESQLAVQEVFLAGGTVQQIEKAQQLADTYERLKKATEESVQLQRDYKTLYDQTASPVQKLADEEARLIKLREQLIANGYDVVQVERMIDEARMNAAEIMDVKQVKTDLDDLKEAAQQFSNAISTAFEDAIISGGNFQDMIKGLENTILQIGTRILFTKPLERALEGMFNNFMPGGSSSNWISDIGSWVGSFFGGAMAGGGSVFPGQTYLVGERGPELFSPQSAGSIIPNDAMPAYSTTININVSGVNNSSDLRRSASQVASMAALAVARGRRNL